MRREGILLTIAAVLAMQGCGRKQRVAMPAPPRVGQVETGIASWYGDPYHGRRAANGEIYDMDQLTAAHRTFPFETIVRVTNLTNEREVEVRITDRGPFVDNRIIDLSRAAARKIEMIGPGTAKVRLKVVHVPDGGHTVQAGAFRDLAGAEKRRQELERNFSHVRIERRGDIHRVLVGAVTGEEAARGLAAAVRKSCGEGMVVRVSESSKSTEKEDARQ